MAQVSNPRKGFNFQIEIGGLNQFLAQKVTIPKVEVEKVEHGDTNYNVKTPGRVMVDDLVIEKLSSTPATGNWAWNWLNVAQDTTTGGGLLPLAIKQTVVIREMDATGAVALNTWVLEGCWVTSISNSDLDRMSSDNIIETVTMSVDRIRKV